MNILNKNLLISGFAICAVSFTSCGEKKDTAKASHKAKETVVAANTKNETVKISLSGLR